MKKYIVLARDKWLSEEVEQAFDILPITQVTAVRYGDIREELHVGRKPIPEKRHLDCGGLNSSM